MLETETDVLRTLREGTYTLDELYGLCEMRCDIKRADGETPPTPQHPTDTVWRRRVRGALTNLRAAGRAERVSRACWTIRGPAKQPTMLLLVLPGAIHGGAELRVHDAARLLRELEEEVDLILTDPPYGLDWGGRGNPGARGFYGRCEALVVPGYVDVEPGRYREWTHDWVGAAAQALRPGGQLVVVTGPQRAAHVQIAAEDHGLNWVASIAARRIFALRTARKPSPAHWTITVACRGPLDRRDRVFNPPSDVPLSQAGNAYPLDWWEASG
jgi:hypothetical protein